MPFAFESGRQAFGKLKAAADSQDLRQRIICRWRTPSRLDFVEVMRLGPRYIPAFTLWDAVDMGFTKRSENGPKTGRILIADDLELNRLISRMHLESLGHIVDEACNGVAALLALGTGQYDLAFIDYKMPALSGELVIRRYKETALSTTPIFIVTTEPSMEIRQSVMEAGAQGLIERPMTLEKISEAINACFKGAVPSSG